MYIDFDNYRPVLNIYNPSCINKWSVVYFKNKMKSQYYVSSPQTPVLNLFWNVEKDIECLYRLYSIATVFHSINLPTFSLNWFFLLSLEYLEVPQPFSCLHVKCTTSFPLAGSWQHKNVFLLQGFTLQRDISFKSAFGVIWIAGEQ